MEIKRGEIYFTKVDKTSGSIQTGDRPAIVVSNNKNNKHSNVLEVVYLTSAKKAKLPTHVAINSAYKESIALCEQITPIRKEQLRRKIGDITIKENVNIKRAIAIALDL